MSILQELKNKNEAPEWLTETGYITLSKGYLIGNETPRDMWSRISKSVSSYTQRDWQEYFKLFWNNWLCPSTPMASNLGTDRGLPISCYGVNTPDSIDGIFKSYHEIACLTKNGGGIGNNYSYVRGRGQEIKGNGKSEGIIPWLKILDSTMVGVSQGSVRRGAAAVYLDIEHPDIDEFISLRKPTGDINRRCLNLHHGITFKDDFMLSLSNTKKNLSKYCEALDIRTQTGEPYFFYIDNANRNLPDWYKKHNLSVKHTQLCTEIMLHNSDEETYVCCVLSMNAVTFFEWKETNAIELAIEFADGVMSEFIDKSKGVSGLEKARNFAIKNRALGLGILGLHSLFQLKMLPFDSLQAYLLNKQIFKFIHEKAEKATKELAEKFGEPEYCKGFNRRNTHLLAVAPTVSNSTISGGWSAGIEPLTGNMYSTTSAKGVFIHKNPILAKILKERNKDTFDTWSSINANNSSVRHLTCLTEEEKNVFKTARELNQHVLIKLAADRQQYIDQGQSLNLFFNKNASEQYIFDVHYNAWKSGLKSLYYMRSEEIIKGDSVFNHTNTENFQLPVEFMSESDCAYCEG